jgi:membrane protein
MLAPGQAQCRARVLTQPLGRLARAGPSGPRDATFRRRDRCLRRPGALGCRKFDLEASTARGLLQELHAETATSLGLHAGSMARSATEANPWIRGGLGKRAARRLGAGAARQTEELGSERPRHYNRGMLQGWKLAGAVRRSWSRWLGSRRGRVLSKLGEAAYAEVASGAVEAMAFDLFLASIPLLALCGWALARVVADNPDVVRDMTQVMAFAPGQVRELIIDHSRRFDEGVAPFALVSAIWMASSALHTPMRVLEKALGVRARAWWQCRLIALGCVIAMLLAVALSAFITLGLMGGPAALLNRLREPDAAPPSFHYSGLVLGIGVITVLLAGFYWVAVQAPPPRRVWPGSIGAMLLVTLASAVLALYVNKLSSLAVYYGSLTAVAVFLLWLWLCSAGVLLGALLNAYLEALARD